MNLLYTIPDPCFFYFKFIYSLKLSEIFIRSFKLIILIYIVLIELVLFSEVRVPCDVCNKMVKKSWLKRHKLVLHSHDRPHLCEECGRTFVMHGIPFAFIYLLLRLEYNSINQLIKIPLVRQLIDHSLLFP